MNKEYKPITNLWKDSEGYRYFGTLKLSSKIKYDGDDFIPLWEWVEQLQEENKQLKERIEYLERSNNRREDTILEQRQEISDLEDNWNSLKEYIKTCISIIKENPIDKRTSFEHSSLSSLGATLSKMQEIEESDK